MRLLPLALSALLIGAGCAPTAPLLPTEPPAAPPAGEAMEPKGDEAAQALAPFYISYTAAQYQKALAEKRPVVLYFWASWCPICRADEPLIKARIEGSDLPIAGFRVDFDTQDDLKRQFRIPYQHTTVMLGVDGQESTRFTGPVDEATFNAALREAAGQG